ncbi:hypothetical protein GCM10007874_22070 [Labrys miyagiensis]|uniref:Uncharacterized protein n=1 Tax=Labrys miyagiensis TaxID=346912 RepID=A0ABQ6CGB0_9HYPH|nr:hypothetical protein GCM10007874_22070 [Labrys miyagiensis]
MLIFHMDGARVANALATLVCTPAEMTRRRDVDVLSFGTVSAFTKSQPARSAASSPSNRTKD